MEPCFRREERPEETACTLCHFSQENCALESSSVEAEEPSRAFNSLTALGTEILVQDQLKRRSHGELQSAIL